MRSATEALDGDDKFFCDACKGLQDAQKRMKIKALPHVLCLHLKRFKYIEQQDRCCRRTTLIILHQMLTHMLTQVHALAVSAGVCGRIRPCALEFSTTFVLQALAVKFVQCQYRIASWC